MEAVQLDLRILQGAKFSRRFSWHGNGTILREIESITPGAPTVITVTGHGLSSLTKTPVFISGVKGAPGLNTDSCAATAATYLTDDTFSVNVSTVGKRPTQGVVEYYSNTDLTNYTARMQIRSSIDSEDVIIELTTENGRISLDADGGIALFIADTDTAALDFTNAVYDLELIPPGGGADRILEGRVTLSPEVTR
jgi:hypothetical protein